MALLQARSEMYFKFVRKKSFVDIDSNSDSSDVNNDETKKKIERQLLNCGLCQSVQELMSEYIFFEEFYMTQNIRYAIVTQYINFHMFKEKYRYNFVRSTHSCIH